MTFRIAAPAAALLISAVALGACHGERKAEADTGTAQATVKTRAPASEVSNSDLQQQAQAAATAASTPVAPPGTVATNTTSTTTTTTSTGR